MKRLSVRVRRAFTLVELLVVIGIIALLISVLLPALNKAREQANITKCASQLRSIGQAMNVYAANNKGRLPQQPVMDGTGKYTAQPVYWLWDLCAESRNAIVNGKTPTGLQAGGGVRDLLYCPMFYDQNIDNHWNYAGGAYSVVGYYLMTQRVKAVGSQWVPLTDAEFPPLYNRMYLSKLTDKMTQEAADKRNSVTPAAADVQPSWVTKKEKARAMGAAELELAADAVMSSGDRPYMNWSAAGGSTLRHMSSHIRKGKPTGGNVLFLDGHVVWRPLEEMMFRHRPSDATTTTAKNRFYF